MLGSVVWPSVARAQTDRCVAPTSQGATIVFLPMPSADIGIEQGARVRVRDETRQCVGEALWDVTAPVTLTVWLDDSETPEKDGATLGEMLSVSFMGTEETKVEPVIADAFGIPEGAPRDRLVFYPDAVFIVSGLRQPLTTSADAPSGTQAFGLNPPVPNPVSEAASVSYVLDEAADVQLLVYDALGRLVLSVHRGQAEEGAHTERLNLRGLPVGSYSVRLVASGAGSVQRASVRVTVTR